VPAIIRWPGRIKPGSVENGVFSGLDWLPTLAAAAGNPNITEQLLKGVTRGGRNYKNHLDGYNQMDLLTGEGPSARREIFYFAGPHLGALRIDDFKYQFFVQPNGWPGEKTTTDMPSIINIRQDPFERTPSNRGESLNDSAGGYPRASTLTPLRDRSRKRSSLAREISFSSQLSGLCSGYQQDVRHWPPSTTTLKPLSCRLSLADRTPIPCCLHRACDPQRTS